jgi:hypothetical protein
MANGGNRSDATQSHASSTTILDKFRIVTHELAMAGDERAASCEHITRLGGHHDGRRRERTTTVVTQAPHSRNARDSSVRRGLGRTEATTMAQARRNMPSVLRVAETDGGGATYSEGRC